MSPVVPQMPSRASSRRTALYDQIVLHIPERPANYIGPVPKPLLPFEGNRLCVVLVQGIASGSDQSKPTFHFGKIVSLLNDMGIPFLLFSYNGAKDTNYEPSDTVVNFAAASKELSAFVAGCGSGKVVVVAHSQGGNLTAFWACNHAHQDELNRISGVFFLAAPLLQTAPQIIRGETRRQGPAYHLKVLNGYAMDLADLTNRLHRNVFAIRYWRDKAAPAETASFLDLARQDAPLAEIVIRDTNHREISGHSLVISTLRMYLAGEMLATPQVNS